MGLIAQAKADAAAFLQDGTFGFAVPITFTNGSITVTINGVHTKHHLQHDEMGAPTNSKNTHITISEQALTTAAYPVRNAKGEVSLVGSRVSVKDSTGITKEYIIRECYPDETIGVLLCILGDYA